MTRTSSLGHPCSRLFSSLTLSPTSCLEGTVTIVNHIVNNVNNIVTIVIHIVNIVNSSNNVNTTTLSLLSTTYSYLRVKKSTNHVIISVIVKSINGCYQPPNPSIHQMAAAMHRSTHPSNDYHPSIHLSIHPSIHPPIFIHPSIKWQSTTCSSLMNWFSTVPGEGAPPWRVNDG